MLGRHCFGFFRHVWATDGNFRGNLGELWGRAKIILSSIVDDVFKFFLFCWGRSGIDLGAFWDNPGPLLVNCPGHFGSTTQQTTICLSVSRKSKFKPCLTITQKLDAQCLGKPACPVSASKLGKKIPDRLPCWVSFLPVPE